MLKKPHHSNPVAELIGEVLRVGGRLTSVFASVNAIAGLLPMETTVLAVVVESPVAPTVPQIGRSLGHSRQMIQRTVNTLMAAGLIEKAPNPHHKLAPLLLPTPEGRKVKQRVDARASEIMAALLRRTSAGKCRRLSGEMRELRHEIEAHLRQAGAS